MTTKIVVPALRFVCTSPPEPFEEEFPLVGEYLMIRHLDEEFDLVCVYIPEDGQFLYREEALKYIMRLAPISTFAGAVEATITLPEDY